MQPTCQGLPVPDRAGLASQNEEDRLEGIVRIGLLAEQSPARVAHHRPMTVHELREGLLILLSQEAVEEFLIANLGVRMRCRQPANAANDRAKGLFGHGRTAPCGLLTTKYSS